MKLVNKSKYNFKRKNKVILLMIPVGKNSITLLYRVCGPYLEE